MCTKNMADQKLNLRSVSWPLSRFGFDLKEYFNSRRHQAFIDTDVSVANSHSSGLRDVTSTPVNPTRFGFVMTSLINIYKHFL